MRIPKEHLNHESRPARATPNPYIGRERHPELTQLLEAGNVGSQPVAVASTDGQEDGGEEGDEDDLPGDGDYDITAHGGKSSPSPLKLIVPGTSHPVPLGYTLPLPPKDTVIASATGDAGHDMSPCGVYDGLAKLAPNTIIDKDQLASMFGVSEKTIRRRIDAGDLPLPHMRMRRKSLWFVGLLLDWLKGKAKQSAEQEKARRQHIRNRTDFCHDHNKTE